MKICSRQRSRVPQWSWSKSNARVVSNGYTRIRRHVWTGKRRTDSIDGALIAGQDIEQRGSRAWRDSRRDNLLRGSTRKVSRRESRRWCHGSGRRRDGVEVWRHDGFLACLRACSYEGVVVWINFVVCKYV